MNDDFTDELDAMERKLDMLANAFTTCMKELVIATELNAKMIAKLGEVVGVAVSPDEADLAKYKMLRDAYEQYAFVRNLTLGDTE